MSKLYLIRHGQASFMSDDYDRLSPLGKQQSVLLGDYWGRRGIPVDTVFIGPLRRHKQTFTAFAEGYARHGLQLPEARVSAEFSEHQGFQLSQAVTPSLVGKDPYITQHYKPEGMDRRTYLAFFRHVMMRWAAGELTHPDFETWQAFRATVARGMQFVRDQTERGQTTVVFTSGGTVAAAVGYALELSDTKAIALNWVVQNSAFTSFFIHEQEIALAQFNTLSHIKDAALQTYV
ncbi:MAG: histidine phosphatase family protein [Methylococcales bacterium]|nr:histidine phosphatase family protein [Methylococcales bacterium]